ncbi:MAG TPA: hypothetical protein VIV57_15880 [Anaeromyxobacter sp.]
MLAPLRPLWTALALGLAQGPGSGEKPEEPAAAPAPEPKPAEEEPGAAAPEPKPAEAEPGAAAPEPKPAEAEPGAAAPEKKPDSTSPKEGAAAVKEQPDKDDNNWVDVGHAFVENRIFAPVLRLDRFFSDERNLDAERSRSFFRWRNEVHFTEDSSRPIFATGLRANLRLPGLNEQLRRLRVVISSDTRDALQALFPRRPGSTNPEEEDTLGTGNAGLRLYFLDTLLSHADLGAGVLTRLPPGLFGQVRFRAAVPVGKRFLTRGVVTGFWRTDTRFGTSEGLELEHPVSRILVSRLTGTATITELSQGVEWGSELGLFAYIDSHTAAQLALAVNGVSRPALAADGVTRPPDLDRFRLYTRARRDIYRRWIFIEVEPELAWPWSLEKRRHSAWGVTFRVELQFQGNEAPPPPPPAPPPEPEDPPPVDALPSRPPPG